MYVSTALRLLGALLIAGFMSVRGLRKRSLSFSGAVAAFFVGICSFSASSVYGVMLLAFYLTGSRATRVKESLKKKWDLEHSDGEGNRGAVQVLCTAGIPTALALIQLLLFGLDGIDPALDWCVSAPSASTVLFVAIVAAYATACGDTWASELGILSRGAPLLIVTCRRVPRGTNGGVSPWGLLMSLCGGAFIGAIATVCIFVGSLLSSPRSEVGCSTSQLWLVPLGAVYGLLGSVIDSVLGAVLQRSYVDTLTGRVSCRLPPGATLSTTSSATAIDQALAAQAAPPASGGTASSFAIICGYDVLSNELVNIVSAAITSALAVLLTAEVPSSTSSIADFFLFLFVALLFVGSSIFMHKY
jgi:uncharacterized protein (TIGR00297 family)